jgi:hypothetical protein
VTHHLGRRDHDALDAHGGGDSMRSALGLPQEKIVIGMPVASRPA